MSPTVSTTRLPTVLSGFLYLSLAQWLAGLALVTLWGVGAIDYGRDVRELQAMMTGVLGGWIGLVGLLLLVGQRNDQRAVLLGSAFLFTGSALTTLHTVNFARSGFSSSPVAEALTLVPAEALLPYTLWLFVATFPKALDTARLQLILRIGASTTLAVGLFLAVANLVGAMTKASWYSRVAHQDPTSLFPVFLAVASLPALAVMVWRLRRASTIDRSRSGLLALPLGILAALLLLVALSLGTEHPTGTRFRMLETIFWPLALALPVTMVLAVRLNRALNARLAAWRVLADLGRDGVILGVLSSPILAFLMILLLPAEPAAEGTRTGWLLLCFILSLVAVGAYYRVAYRSRYRQALQERGSMVSLQKLHEALRMVGSPADFGQWLGEIPPALGVTSVRLFAADGRTLESSAAAPFFDELPVQDLSFKSIFGVRTTAVDLESFSLSWGGEAFTREARSWLSERRVSILQPVFRTDGRLLGVLAVGERRDQRPFSTADLEALGALSMALGLFLERFLVESATAPSQQGLDPDGPSGSQLDEGLTHGSELLAAVQCPLCDRVFASSIKSCPECEIEPFPLDEPLIVARKYQLDRCIGSGAMGRVYSAVDLMLDRQVAIKFIPQGGLRADRALGREARAMAALENPTLATVYAVETLGSRLFVVSELLEGGTLGERIADSVGNGTRSALEVAELGVQLLDALGALHRLELLHGDIKPSNVGFDREGRLKLLDFGMVHLLNEPLDSLGSPEFSCYRTSGMLPSGHVGTPLYSPPEAWLGEPVGTSADLWPVAALLWEYWTGVHPFERLHEDPSEAGSRTKQAIVTGDIAPLPSEQNGDGALRAVLERALRRDPALRYVDVPAFREALAVLMK